MKPFLCYNALWQLTFLWVKTFVLKFRKRPTFNAFTSLVKHPQREKDKNLLSWKIIRQINSKYDFYSEENDFTEIFVENFVKVKFLSFHIVTSMLQRCKLYLYHWRWWSNEKFEAFSRNFFHSGKVGENLSLKHWGVKYMYFPRNGSESAS